MNGKRKARIAANFLLNFPSSAASFFVEKLCRPEELQPRLPPFCVFLATEQHHKLIPRGLERSQGYVFSYLVHFLLKPIRFRRQELQLPRRVGYLISETLLKGLELLDGMVQLDGFFHQRVVYRKLLDASVV